MNIKKILSFNHLSTPYLPTQKENKFPTIQLNVGYVTKFGILKVKNIVTWVESNDALYERSFNIRCKEKCFSSGCISKIVIKF